MLLTISAIAVCAVCVNWTDELLYAVDFDIPGQLTNAPVVVGLGSAVRRVPSAVRGGVGNQPLVVDSEGPLNRQPARLAPVIIAGAPVTAQSCSFDVAGPLGFHDVYSAYRVEFDMVIRELVGASSSFALFADTPTIRAIRWLPSGAVIGPNGELAGTWFAGRAYHVATVWDLSRSDVSLSIDGEAVGSYVFNASAIETFRLSLGGSVGPIMVPPGVVGIDNVRIWSVPGPTGAVLCCVASIWAPWYRRRI